MFEYDRDALVSFLIETGRLDEAGGLDARRINAAVGDVIRDLVERWQAD